jgi:CSLREA domain-containing protein
MNASRIACLAGLFVMLAASSAAAAVFTVTRTDDPVPDGCQLDDCSLREAIVTANALSGPDRIVLPAGLYILTISGDGFDDASVGDLDILDDTEIAGAGADTTTILGENANRLFNVTPGNSAHIHNVRLDGGRAGFGGAILQNGALTLEDAIVSGNQATGDGGGIRGASGSLTLLRRVQMLDNSAGGNGGAIEGNEVTTEIFDSTLSGNSAVDGGAVDGYDIHVTRSLIQGNTASGDGGGLHGVGGCSCTNLEVHASTLVGNSAVANGGAIHASAVATVELSTLSGNSASEGGAIYAATTNGGSSIDQLQVQGSTLYQNTASQGSAIYFFNDPAGLGAPPTIGNTLASGTCVHAGTASTFDALLGNIESPGNTCDFGIFSQHSVPANALLLGALADNGGPTPTHLPQAGSALIGAGWDITCEPLDQRGYVRADGCDTGAVERGALDDVIFHDGFEEDD